MYICEYRIPACGKFSLSIPDEHIFLGVQPKANIPFLYIAEKQEARFTHNFRVANVDEIFEPGKETYIGVFTVDNCTKILFEEVL